MLLGKFGHLSSTVFTSLKSRIIPFCFCKTKNGFQKIFNSDIKKKKPKTLQ